MAKKEIEFSDILVDRKPSKGVRSKRYTLTRLFKQQGGLCIYCKEPMWLLWNRDNIYERSTDRGESVKLATLEHKLAKRSLFGSERKNNLACSCYECNQDKDHLSHLVYKLMRKYPTADIFFRWIKKKKLRFYNKKRYAIRKLKRKVKKLYEKFRHYKTV